MNLVFAVFPVLFLAVFVLVFGTILSGIVRQHKRERKNDASPRLTVQATVMARRDEMNHYPSGRTHGGTHRTRYFATFQFDSGDRLELELQGFEYGMLVEGDFGRLTFQGTRFLSFERM